MKEITLSKNELRLLLNEAYEYGLNDTWNSVYKDWRESELKRSSK